ncbi:MAG: hypothetical protein ACRC1M_02220 [Methanobacteriaceae archaeon]
MNPIVTNITQINISENPKINDISSPFVFLEIKYPINTGMTGNIQGDRTEAIPAINEKIGRILNGEISILITN